MIQTQLSPKERRTLFRAVVGDHLQESERRMIKRIGFRNWRDAGQTGLDDSYMLEYIRLQ